MLSVLAVQERLICELDTAVALRLVGVDGGVVSGGGTETVTVVFAFIEPAELVAVRV